MTHYSHHQVEQELLLNQGRPLEEVLREVEVVEAEIKLLAVVEEAVAQRH